MKHEVKHTFRRDLGVLGEVADFVGTFVTGQAIDQAVRYFVDLAVEELFTNMVKYNADGGDTIEIGLSADADQLVIVLTDLVPRPFDPTRYEAVDVKASLQERSVGGLGIHLVQQIMDEVYYEYRDQHSKITLVKKLNASHA